MKKLILFFILMVLLFLQGCTSSLQKQTGVNVDLSNLIIVEKNVSESEEFYIIEFSIDNKTNYPLISTDAFLRPVIDNEVKQMNNSVLIEASLIKVNENNRFFYNATIPKTFFEIDKNIKRNILQLDIRGCFINSNKQIINEFSGWGGFVILHS